MSSLKGSKWLMGALCHPLKGITGGFGASGASRARLRL